MSKTEMIQPGVRKALKPLGLVLDRECSVERLPYSCLSCPEGLFTLLSTLVYLRTFSRKDLRTSSDVIFHPFQEPWCSIFDIFSSQHKVLVSAVIRICDIVGGVGLWIKRT